MSAVAEREAVFYSGGLRIAATLYLPPGATGRAPAIVCCHGMRADRKVILPNFARAFAEAGYVALVFDYRGFGESEGKRFRLIARERDEDIGAATTFLQLQDEVDAERIAYFGISYGAANAVSAGAADARAKAVVAVVGFADGDRWMRRIRREWEYAVLLRELEEDRKLRVTTGESRRVHVSHILVPTPAEEAMGVARPTANLPDELPLEVADDIVHFKPERVVAEISPRPLLVVGADADHLVGYEESLRLYELAREPKRLHVLRGLSHYEAYTVGAPEVIRETLSFLRGTFDHSSTVAPSSGGRSSW